MSGEDTEDDRSTSTDVSHSNQEGEGEEGLPHGTQERGEESDLCDGRGRLLMETVGMKHVAEVKHKSRRLAWMIRCS